MLNDFGVPLTKKQQDILNKLIECKNEGRGISVRGIAADLELSPSLVSYTIKQFEKRGILKRSIYNPNDYNIILSAQPQMFYANLIEARCGANGMLNEDYVLDRVPIATGQFSIVNPEKVILIKAKGDSMEPKFFEGDIVLAEKISSTIKPISGRIYLVISENEAMIKKYVTIGNQGNLVSLNPAYSPIPVTEELGARFIAEVKGIIRNDAL